MSPMRLTFIALLFCSGLYAQTLSIYTCNVGQGDGLIITTTAGSSMLIDGGRTNAGRDEILSTLSTLGITKLNYIVASHYDADHIGNIDRILAAGIEVDSVFDRGTSDPPTTITYSEYEAAISSKRHTIELGKIIDLGAGVLIRCVTVNGKWSSNDSLGAPDENERSIGLLLEYGQFRFFTGGDLANGIEDTVGNLIGDISVLKVSHHGSKHSSSSYFLNKTMPEAVLNSVGSPNAYDHPDQETMNRLDSLNNIQTIYQTTSGDGGTSPKVKVMGTILTQIWPDSFVIDSDIYSLGVETPLSDIDLGVDSLNFGDVYLDSLLQKNLIIYNRGSGDLVISDMILSDTVSFSVDIDSLLIAPGDSQLVIVSFSPKLEKLYRDTLRIENNDSTLSVWLRGEGIQTAEPIISLNIDSLNFGDVFLNDEASQEFKIYNSGSAPLEITQINTKDTLSFKVNPLSATVNPGDSLIVLVSFGPVAEKPYRDTLTIENNDSTLFLVVSGQGKIIPRPIIVINAEELVFDSVYLFSTSTKNLTIINSGTATLTISDISVKNPSVFSAVPDSLEIAPGDSQTITVSFKPLQEIIYQDTLGIISNDQTLEIYLSGSGESGISFESSSSNLTMNDTTGFYELWVKMDKMEGNPAVSLIVSQDGGGSFPDTLNCTANIAGNVFSAEVPAITVGKEYKYYFEVRNAWGEVKRDPAEAPLQTYIISVTSQVPGDVNSDAKIDIFDLLALLKQLADPSLRNSLGDVDQNGSVDIFDLLSLLKSLSAPK